jgi:hypothetical protein
MTFDESLERAQACFKMPSALHGVTPVRYVFEERSAKDDGWQVVCMCNTYNEALTERAIRVASRAYAILTGKIRKPIYESNGATQMLRRMISVYGPPEAVKLETDAWDNEVAKAASYFIAFLHVGHATRIRKDCRSYREALTVAAHLKKTNNCMREPIVYAVDGKGRQTIVTDSMAEQLALA